MTGRCDGRGARNDEATRSSSTTRLGAARTACFMLMTTSLSSASLKPLDEHVVGGQAGAADAEAAAPDDVDDLVGDLRRAGARRGSCRGSVRTPRGPPRARRRRAGAPRSRRGRSGRRPRSRSARRAGPRLVLPGVLQRRAQRTVGVASGSGRVALVGAAVERADRVEVGPRVVGDQRAIIVVGERLGPAQQGDAGDQAPQVPGVRAEVGLVEVVDANTRAPSPSM